jgi:hypothetical protein
MLFVGDDDPWERSLRGILLGFPLSEKAFDFVDELLLLRTIGFAFNCVFLVLQASSLRIDPHFPDDFLRFGT